MKNIFKNIKNWNSSLKLGTAITLGGIILVGTSIIYSANRNHNSSTSETTDTASNRDSDTQSIVDNKIEEIIRPYNVECVVSTYFYDETDSSEIREKAIVSVPGASRTYMLSEGCDYTYPNGSFSVVAAVSGKITDKRTDPTFGDIVVLTHESGVKFIYASLASVNVNVGQEIKQGETIAMSGTSLYTQTLGSSLHFEIVKGKKHLNPEKLYTTSVENL